MIELTKENVVGYVASKLDFFDINADIRVSAVGEGALEDDGDCFINYVYRVSDGTHNLIVKQARPSAKNDAQFQVDIMRFKSEYDAMTVHRAIVPEYVPELFCLDEENNVFISEDVSYLKIARFQILKGVIFPRLGELVGRYVAGYEFFTSEFYLDRETFRELDHRFENPVMRSLMEKCIFLTNVSSDNETNEKGWKMDEAFRNRARLIAGDEKVILARYKLRHLFMHKVECMMHCDLHTSNIFAGPDEIKVIDMEYAHFGPFSYDLGYFAMNSLATYVVWSLREGVGRKKREEMKAFALSTFRDVYETFCSEFNCFREGCGKTEYRDVPGMAEDFNVTVLREMTGFAASAQVSRIADDIAYIDFDMIENPVMQAQSKCMALTIDSVLLRKWESYRTIEEVLRDVVKTQVSYCKNAGLQEYM